MAKRGVAAEDALYLYAVTRSSRTKVEVSSPGIDGVHPVHGLPCGDFVCWASAIDQNSFAKALEGNMDNLEWLAVHGVRHQQVVAEIAQHETVIPARFGTLFSSQAALAKDVETRKAALQKVFARIADTDEWGVKVFAEQSPAPPAQAASSGREYLQQKAARLKKRPERDDSALRDLATALQKVASDSATTGKVSGAQPDLVWQATYLVPRSHRKQWERVLEEFVERWDGLRRIEVNGPWPPYSFVSDAN